MEQDNIKLKEVFEELQDEVLNPELVKDNMLHFKLDDTMYRVRMPNQKELAEANAKRNEKFIELVQQKNALTLKSLIKVLKENQDIDIEKMNKDIKDLELKIQDAYLTLAKCKDNEEKRINKCIENIRKIKMERMDLVIEKTGFLAPCIENQAQDIYYNYLASMCTDIGSEEDGEVNGWVSQWKSFDEFTLDNSKLPYVALGRLTELMMNI